MHASHSRPDDRHHPEDQIGDTTKSTVQEALNILSQEPIQNHFRPQTLDILFEVLSAWLDQHHPSRRSVQDATTTNTANENDQSWYEQAMLNSVTPQEAHQQRLEQNTNGEQGTMPVVDVSPKDLRTVGFADDDIAYLTPHLPDIAKKITAVFLEGYYRDALFLYARSILDQRERQRG